MAIPNLGVIGTDISMIPGGDAFHARQPFGISSVGCVVFGVGTGGLPGGGPRFGCGVVGGDGGDPFDRSAMGLMSVGVGLGGLPGGGPGCVGGVVGGGGGDGGN